MTYQDIRARTKLVEAELMGLLLQKPNLAVTASQHISAEDLEDYSRAFAIALDAQIQNKNLLHELLTANIPTSELFQNYTSRTIEHICRDVKELSNARKIYRILEGFLKKVPTSATESFVADIQRELLSGISKKESESSEVSAVIKQFRDLQGVYEEKFKNGGGIIGTSTGYSKIDDLIDGFRPEHFWVIGGYTNVGKTFAALNMMANLIKAGKRVVFYSVEMSKVDVLCRLLGIMTGDNGLSILKGYGKDYDKVNEALKVIEASQSAIYSSKAELSDIESSMHEETLKTPVDLFIVDFIQIVTVKGAKSEYEKITTCSEEFQQIAKRLKTPIIVLSQISNEGAKNVEQDVMTFKGSGAIGQAADLAIEIVHSDSITKEERFGRIQRGEPIEMKWKIRKNRHGRTGYIEMNFNGKTGVFELTEFEK